MLKGLKNQGLALVPPSHVDLFVEHYDLIKRWALQLTNHDQHAAEDLLHDTFINFTLGKPDLSSIQNLNGYIYTIMRNLHLSEVRRASRMPVRSFSVVEYDTAEMPFWASDPRERIRIRDEIGAVCQYSCVRKETSKGGSLLILRFFHGYYPDEIAAILKTVRPAVNTKLAKVRAEAKLYLEEPDRLKLIGDRPPTPLSLNDYISADDLRLRLREYIFESRQGDCPQASDLQGLYGTDPNAVPNRQTLAHIVSCRACIETVNTMLDIPSLASRYPLDVIGNDPGKRGGGTGGGSGSSGAGGDNPMLESYINRREIHYHHEPKELCIAVNGQFQGLQTIVSGRGEMLLSIDMNETIGFVEVFSEIGVRMLMLHVDPPPTGDGNQSACVELSGGRRIDANLNFAGAHPALQITYNDPVEVAVAVAPEIDMSLAPHGSEADILPSFLKEEKGSSRFADLLRSFFRPARFATGFAALLIAALIIFQFGPFTAVTAAELLRQSAEAETAQLANKERVLHRTLDLEESKDGQILSRKRIDVWQSTEKGITARRLYDEQGRLAMGDWRAANGVQTIYRRGESAKLQPMPEKRAAIGFDDAWQLSPSANEFTSMVIGTDQAQLETRDSEYVISLATVPQQTGADRSGGNITKASITLSKEDLHAIEQNFTLTVGGEARDYRMTEAAFEWRPANSVAPAVFEPNVELTNGAAVKTITNATANPLDINGHRDPVNANPANSNSVVPAMVATAGLEVEVVEALNRAGAFTGEQVDVSRSDDKVVVTAMVETPARKQELLNALAGVKNNPAVRIRIETVTEVLARTKPSKTGQLAGTPDVQQFEITDGQSPAYAELRKRLSDAEARRIADSVLRRIESARSHARAMNQISQRFSQSDLQSLKPEERTRWLGLIRGHAQSFVSQMESIRRDLQQFFPEADSAGGGGGAISGDAELQAKVRELFNASAGLERGLSQSFAFSTGAGSSSPVKTSAFWRQFGDAIGIARSLSK